MDLIENIERKLEKIMIKDDDPFVEETCKNIYRALLVVAENEKPKIDDITKILEDDNLTIYLLKKFDYLSKEVYHGLLNYIVLDVSNEETLKTLIHIIRKSISADNKVNQSNNNILRIKMTSHKLINEKKYTKAEFMSEEKKIEESLLFKIGSWWGEGAYGHRSIIITKDKELYRLFSNIEYLQSESKRIEDHKIEKYEPLTDEEYKNLISIINDLLNTSEEYNMIFDAGFYIIINYNGTKKSFINMIDTNKYQRIKNSIEELFEG